MINIKYIVCPDPKKPEHSCRPEKILRNLIKSGAFKMSLDTIMEKTPTGEPEGNCHEIAVTIMVDLIRTGNAKGWAWLEGYKSRESRDESDWEHSWLEYDGWAVDASHAHSKKHKRDIPILIFDAQFYRKNLKLKITKQRNAKQTKKWIEKHGWEKSP